MTSQTPSTVQTLRTLRIVWVAMLASQVIFLVVVMVILKPGSAGKIDPAAIRTLHIASLGFMIVTLPGGYMMRNQTYKRHWQVNAVAPQGYFTGNLVLFAMCEATAMFAVVVTYLAGAYIPYIIPAAVAVATQVVNLPDGRPMQPREPDLSRR